MTPARVFSWTELEALPFVGRELAPMGETISTAQGTAMLRLWSSDLRPDARVEIVCSPAATTIAVSNLATLMHLRGSMTTLVQRPLVLLDANLEHVRVLPHEWEVCALAFHPRDATLATIGGYRTADRWNWAMPGISRSAISIRVWRVSDGECIGAVSYEDGLAERVAFSDDGDVLLVDGTAGVRAYRLPTAEPTECAPLDEGVRARLAQSAVDAARRAAGPDARSFAVREGSAAVTVVHPPARRALLPPSTLATSAALSTDGRTLVVDGAYRTACWDVATGARTGIFDRRFVGFDARDEACVYDERSGEPQIVRWSDGAVLHRLPRKVMISRVARDGVHAIVQRNDALEWRDLAADRCVASLVSNSGVTPAALAIAPTSDVAVVHAGATLGTRSLLWRLDGSDERIELDAGPGIYRYARYVFDARGEHVAVGLANRGGVALFRTNDGSRHWHVELAPPEQPDGERAIDAIAFDPRGEWIAVSISVRSTHHVLLLDAARGTPIARVGAFNANASALVFTRDGARLLIAHDADCVTVIALREP